MDVFIPSAARAPLERGRERLRRPRLDLDREQSRAVRGRVIQRERPLRPRRVRRHRIRRV
eukprot:2910-Pelagococcus_subviridis.AAC.4